MTTIGSATYSPEDNKLRIYPLARLPRDTYDRVRAAGFIWAPKQELFVAPMWTPEREDLAAELCGGVGDEDKSLVERSEERAERFDEYSEKRLSDAHNAREAVSAIADHIPLGQPVLVGHHSERHARKDAERIENGMRKAVKMWETSKYWTDRAAGALRHAKYKEAPTVRARRIKTIEADQRRWQRALDVAVVAHTFWSRPDLTHEAALHFAGNSTGSTIRLPRKDGDRPDFDQRPDAYTVLSGSYPNLYAPRTLAEVVEVALRVYPDTITHYSRWIAHCENRLAYEKAMLAEQGASHLIAPKKRPAQLPLLNYRQAEIVARRWGKVQTFLQMEMTSAEYKAIYSEQRGTLDVGRTHRMRFCLYQREDGKISRFPRHDSIWCAVFLTDSKAHPKPEAVETPAPEPAMRREIAAPRQYVAPARTEFDDMREALKTGVKVVSAPQLFPTPAHVARMMTDRAGLLCGRRILEPSAGTGNLVRAAINAATGADCCRVVVVEVSQALAEGLRQMRDRTVHANEGNFQIEQGDFLECNGALGKFDVVLMNPPFANGADIRHILHARMFLKPGGKIVAICANGPRQAKELQPLADSWEPLPDDTFKEQGTGVRTVLLTISA